MKIKTGVAFGDYITTEKIKKRKNQDEGEGRPMRGNFLPIILFFCISILVIRLINLQVVKGAHYKTLSDENRTRTVAIHAPRGVMLDRNGIPLVYNIPGFRKIENKKVQLIGAEEAVTRMANGEKSLEVDSLREYPYKEEASHVLGYVAQISEDELRLPEYADYKPGDIIGKTGIEEQYESVLKGIDGKELVEVDSKGQEIRKLGSEDPVVGEDIKLTLDIATQKALSEAMKNVKKGAAIVSTPKGEILAMISKPSFDPNLFTLDKKYKPASESSYLNVADILGDSTSQPLLNRAVSGVYPPGSTFKLITAASGLDNSIIDENFKVEDTGIFHVGAFSFANWYYTQYGKTEGVVDVVKAIARSNDIFFYHLAGKVGVDKLSSEANEFNLGKQLGIDLGGEAKGLVPDPSWKEKTIGESWYLGDTYHYGIGQGYVLTTPLQVSGFTQAIANAGKLYKPHILKDKRPEIVADNLLKETSADLIKEGMVKSCSAGGVAWPFFEFKVKNSKLKVDGKNFMEALTSSTSGNMKDYRKVSIACKTGTAQWGGEKDLPHAWITLFAPAQDPEIVVTVLSEASGEGSNIAGPIAKKVVEEYFLNK